MWLSAPSGPSVVRPPRPTSSCSPVVSLLTFLSFTQFSSNLIFSATDHATYINGVTMIASVRYTIALDGLIKCPHDWDCRSLRAHAAQCSTCQVLFSIIRLHFACRLEWSVHNLSRVGDHVHLLSTSDLFRDLLLESDISDNDEDDNKKGHSLELAIWSLWSPFEHPIVRDILKCAAGMLPLRVKIERSRRRHGICEWTTTSPARPCAYLTAPCRVPRRHTSAQPLAAKQSC